jgi:hypothetical protein
MMMTDLGPEEPTTSDKRTTAYALTYTPNIDTLVPDSLPLEGLYQWLYSSTSGVSYRGADSFST